MESIESVLPKTVEVTIKGETLVVKPFKFAQLPKVFKYVQPIIELLNKSQGLSRPALIAAVIAEYGDNVNEIIKLTTGKDQAWIEELESDEGVQVLGAVLEVNFDFFIKKVMPAITKGVVKVVPIGLTS